VPRARVSYIFVLLLKVVKDTFTQRQQGSWLNVIPDDNAVTDKSATSGKLLWFVAVGAVKVLPPTGDMTDGEAVGTTAGTTDDPCDDIEDVVRVSAAAVVGADGGVTDADTAGGVGIFNTVAVETATSAG
jgi:hypothetical protein